MTTVKIDQYMSRHDCCWQDFHRQLREVMRDYAWKRNVRHVALALSPSSERKKELVAELINLDLEEMQEIDRAKLKFSLALGELHSINISELAGLQLHSNIRLPAWQRANY